jgi:nicotinate-nucleotide adenylyltransferase
MRVALFGGTFDPVHNGHLSAARELVKRGIVEEVWFIPVYWHAFKASRKVTELRHRKEMVRLAIRGERAMRLIDLNENPTYTIDTIRKIKRCFPNNEYFWLLGTNLIGEFSSWREPTRIMREARLILYPVPGSEGERSRLVDSSGPIRVKARGVDLSSTVIRRKLQMGQPISKLVPSAVERYIMQNNLYAGSR